MLMSSESHAQPHSSHLISLLCAKPSPSRLSSLLSAPPSSCCYKPLLAHKSLFSFVIRWKSSSSSSSFFVFFNDHSFVIFFFKFYLSNLIWEIHFEGRVLINKTPSNTDLLPKTTKYQHWFDFFFFQILHALFLLKIYLFSCWVLKKICGYMLCNFIYLFCGCSTFLSYVISEKKSEFGILVPTPLSLFKTSSHFGLRSDFLNLAWFGYFSFRFRLHIFGIGIGYFSSCGIVQMLGISIGFKFNRAIFHVGYFVLSFLLTWFLTYTCEEH